MTFDGGDRNYGHGDSITCTYSNADNSVDPASEGMWVMIDGDHQVDTADNSNNTRLDGVLSDEVAADGDRSVWFRGAVYARVTSGVSAGDELGPSATAGVATSGGSSGFVALTDATENPSGSSEYYALVVLD